MPRSQSIQRKFRPLSLFAVFLMVAAACDSPPATPSTPIPTPATTATSAGASSPTTATQGETATVPIASSPTVANSPTMAAGLSGELSFLVFGEPAEAKAFVDVAKGFQEANPDVKINTEAVPSQPNHLLKLATEFAAGDPPDVWVIDYRRFGLLQNAGVVEAAQPYLDQSTVIKASDFYTKPLEPFTLTASYSACR